MASSFSPPGKTLAGLDPETVIRAPIGALSPLWLPYMTAIAGGLAYWSLMRWAPVNLEALSGVAFKTPVLPAPKLALVTPDPVTSDVTETAANAVDTVESLVAHTFEASLEAVAAVAETLAPQAPVIDPVIEAPVSVAAPTADDLTRLVGIGPKLAAALAERGVSTFADMARLTTRDIDKLDKELSLKGRAVRDAWVAQAKRFAAELSA